MNILFSATRQWNPGDEFILMGVINILREAVGEFNPILYNRNPDIRQDRYYLNPFRNEVLCNLSFRGKGIIDAFFRLGFWENSFKDNMSLDMIDLVVFAGSPEWIGGKLLPLYKKLLNYDRPILYLGIGSGTPLNFSALRSPYIDILQKASLITVRDNFTYDLLKPLNPYKLPCPALFSSTYEKKITDVKKVGLIFSTYKSVPNNRIDKKTYDFMLRIYKELTDLYECELICHYIDELYHAGKVFGDMKVHYSYDAQAYTNIYKRFDLVVGPRLHGIGIAASMGIPGILIAHDMRGDAGNGFLAYVIKGEHSNLNTVLKEVARLSDNVSSKNSQILEHKRATKLKYIELISNVLNKNT